MEKALWQRAARNLLLASSLVGCATSVTAAEGDSWTSRLMFWKSNAPPETTAAIGPDFSKSYADEPVKRQPSADAEVAPAEPAADEPSGWQKFTSAVSGASSKATRSVRSVFSSDEDDDQQPVAKVAAVAPRDTGKAASRDPFIMLAETMERGGNLQGAAKQYELALQSNKNSLPALLGYARLQDRQGNFDAAINLYERAHRAHPQDAAVCNDLALCLSRQGRKEEAAARMNQAVKLQPERKLYRNNLAKLLVDVNEPGKALEHLSAAHPPAVANYNLGYLLAQQGNRALAARHFAQALELDASLVDARSWLDTLNEQSTVAAAPQGQPHYAAPSPDYGPNHPSVDRTPSPYGPGPGYNTSQGVAHPATTPLPQVLRPNTVPGPRYGMAPTPYEPPSQY